VLFSLFFIDTLSAQIWVKGLLEQNSYWLEAHEVA